MATRRVVTAIDEHGKSYVLHDGETPGSIDVGRIRLDDVWIDDPANPDPAGKHDPVATGRNSLVGPAGGSVVRVVTFYPPTRADSPDVETLAANVARFDRGDAMDHGEAGEAGWHTTRTIDYGIVLKGEIELGLDSGWVRLKAGDVVVQRATRHAWRVTDEPCDVAFVLISSPNYER